jgi:hypothetical protein
VIASELTEDSITTPPCATPNSVLEVVRDSVLRWPGSLVAFGSGADASMGCSVARAIWTASLAAQDRRCVRQRGASGAQLVC